MNEFNPCLFPKWSTFQNWSRGLGHSELMFRGRGFAAQRRQLRVRPVLTCASLRAPAHSCASLRSPEHPCAHRALLPPGPSCAPPFPALPGPAVFSRVPALPFAALRAARFTRVPCAEWGASEECAAVRKIPTSPSYGSVSSGFSSLAFPQFFPAVRAPPSRWRVRTHGLRLWSRERGPGWRCLPPSRSDYNLMGLFHSE